MKKYYLKKSVRDDLVILNRAIDNLLEGDKDGMLYPYAAFIPLMFRFISRYLWCNPSRHMFKKI